MLKRKDVRRLLRWWALAAAITGTAYAKKEYIRRVIRARVLAKLIRP